MSTFVLRVMVNNIHLHEVSIKETHSERSQLMPKSRKCFLQMRMRNNKLVDKSDNVSVHPYFVRQAKTQMNVSSLFFTVFIRIRYNNIGELVRSSLFAFFHS